MAKVRANWIAEGLGAKQPNTASSSPDKSEEPNIIPTNVSGGKSNSLTKSEYLMMVEDITADMRRTGQPTQDIMLYVKFLISDHCEFIPKEIRKGDTLDS